MNKNGSGSALNSVPGSIDVSNEFGHRKSLQHCMPTMACSNTNHTGLAWTGSCLTVYDRPYVEVIGNSHCDDSVQKKKDTMSIETCNPVALFLG